MRPALAAVGRIVLALALVAATGAVVATGVAVPVPDPTPVPAATVAVPAQPTTLVCPGPLRLPTELQPGDDAAYDPQFDTAPQASRVEVDAVTIASGSAGAGDATLTPLGSADAAAQVVAAGDTGAAQVPGPTGALVLRADAVSDAPAWVAGTLQVRTDGGDLRGLVTAPCQAPSAQSWLVGGGTHVGSSARLVLQNPGLTPASVVVRMWGPTGPVELAGAPEYLVPPGSERVVLLEGVAAEQGRIVVQTTASGGLVTAYLQDSRVAGLTPQGVDDVVAGTAPSTRQVVTGISVAPPAPAGSAGTDVVNRATGTVLRLLAPGDAGAHVAVTLLGPDGSAALPGGELTLGPGGVLDVPLDDLGPGDYTAVVTADQPVVAGAMVVRGAAGDDAVQDRAWIAATAGGAGPVALPSGVDGRLVLAVVPDEEHHGRSPVVVEGADGTRSERMLEEGATLSLPLGSATGGGLTVRTGDPRVVWCVVFEGDAMISVLGPVSPRSAQPEVAVEVR